jgi:hypothetical protein
MMISSLTQITRYASSGSDTGEWFNLTDSWRLVLKETCYEIVVS